MTRIPTSVKLSYIAITPTRLPQDYKDGLAPTVFGYKKHIPLPHTPAQGAYQRHLSSGLQPLRPHPNIVNLKHLLLAPALAAVRKMYDKKIDGRGRHHLTVVFELCPIEADVLPVHRVVDLGNDADLPRDFALVESQEPDGRWRAARLARLVIAEPQLHIPTSANPRYRWLRGRERGGYTVHILKRKAAGSHHQSEAIRPGPGDERCVVARDRCPALCVARVGLVARPPLPCQAVVRLVHRVLVRVLEVQHRCGPARITAAPVYRLGRDTGFPLGCCLGPEGPEGWKEDGGGEG